MILAGQNINGFAVKYSSLSKITLGGATISLTLDKNFAN